MGEAARRQRQAARLADRLLAEKIVTGEWDDTEDEGDFGDDWPEYRWTLETAEWTQPDAIQVGVTVYFTIQGREQSVRVATLIDETAETESSS
ncbi:MAG: hypothetical protein BWZ10_03037 [candidate division BRC1 bacterium ADurb.BinA364]|nr:MAG: hypothetical protein BWZ10_03037 [candidate division BRC1 bacterium ADurb.BinA364]